MKIARFSVYHPVLTIMVSLIVLILGGISLVKLPIDLMPDVTRPVLSVSTSYENASPEEVEELITRPIEEAMSAVPGVTEVTSTSTEGQSNVRVTFSWSTDLDAAANDMRDRLDQVTSKLPDDATRPTLRKFDLASFPITIMGVSSGLDSLQLRSIIEEQVKYRLERVPGVASVDIWGGQEREIHVDLRDDRLKALGLPLDQVINSIIAQNTELPAGTIDRGNLEVVVRTLGSYTSLNELKNTVVAIRNGTPLQLSAIADVIDSSVRERSIVRVNGQPGIMMAVNKQSGTNTVEVARGVQKEVKQLNNDLKQLNIIPLIDTSDYIQRAISNVSTSAIYGGCLAILVLLFFLRSIRSTAVISTAIPLSIVATFVLMYFGGMTLNIMTLGGLALGVGMLLDNSIVTLENIYRLSEGGMDSTEAAVAGSEEVTAPIIASTLTTVAVFLPLIFMGGMQGILFKQFSLVVGFALLCSLVVSLSVVPMLAAKWLHPSERSNSSGWGLFNIFERLFSWMEKEYKGALKASLNHPFITAGAVVVVLGACITLVPYIGVEFMPSTDEGEVRIDAEAQVGTRLGISSGKFTEIENKIRASVPEMATMFTRLGGSGWHSSGGHSGNIRVKLKPEAERSRSSEEIAAALRKQLSNIPGITVRMRTGQGFNPLSRMGPGGDKIEVDIRGYDFDTASELADRVRALVSSVPGVTDAKISRETGTPEDIVEINRMKASDLKLSISQIAQALQTVLSGTNAGYYREGGDEYAIRVELKNAAKLNMTDILDLTVTNSEGIPVILRNVVEIHPRSGPVLVERKNQERIVTVSGDVFGRDMGSVYADIQEKLKTLPVPKNFQILLSGDYQDQQQAFLELAFGLVLALILVYMVMASLYESLRDPFIVMFSVPLAAIGVILMLYLTHTTLNVQSFIGIIMLSGIVVNNAILLVDHTNLLRRRDGMPLRDAIKEAGRRRLRPILMTALTTMLALIPLAIGIGEGGEAQAPLARAVIGGLLSSTLITLLFIPVVYLLFERGTEKEAQVQEQE